MSRDPAVFFATVNDEGKVQFDFPSQVKAYCRRLAGQAVDVIIAPTGHAKTKKQQDGFHVMVKPWATEGGHRIEDLKRDILRAVFGTIEVVDAITGELKHELREPRTSNLNRAQYCELIERSLQLGAEFGGVVLIAPDEYRRMKEQEVARGAR